MVAAVDIGSMETTPAICEKHHDIPSFPPSLPPSLLPCLRPGLGREQCGRLHGPLRRVQRHLGARSVEDVAAGQGQENDCRRRPRGGGCGFDVREPGRGREGGREGGNEGGREGRWAGSAVHRREGDTHVVCG
jgi:hypothetical protein